VLVELVSTSTSPQKSIASILKWRSGIGAAVAKAFVQSKCTKLAITDLNEDTLAFTKSNISQLNHHIEVLAIPGDITEETFVKSFAARVVEKFGRIDYAVNCAGVNAPSLRTHETDLDLFEHVNRVNYRGVWLAGRAWITQMLTQDPLPEHNEQRGAIVHIASQLGLIARPNAGTSVFPPPSSSHVYLSKLDTQHRTAPPKPQS
jgi:NAD(P)-dependent dehydrogenase (short-subunit alcohol dehydrogenase family)